MQRKPTPHADIAIAIFLIAVCIVALWESRKIPPGTFEPLGSGPVPQTIAGLIILLCLLVIVRAWRQLRQKIVAENEEFLVLRRADTVIIAVLTIIYVGLLHARWLDFALLTTLYLIVSIGLLLRFQLRQLPAIIAVAIVMAYGCEYLFTRVFVVDLPGAF